FRRCTIYRHDNLFVAYATKRLSDQACFSLVGYGLKSLFSLSLTPSSILISGGQPRLWPSPGSLCVASIPIFVPMANSVVAWSRTSAGPLVKIASRCGSVLAHKRNRTSLVLCTFTSASTTTMYLLNII